MHYTIIPTADGELSRSPAGWAARLVGVGMQYKCCAVLSLVIVYVQNGSIGVDGGVWNAIKKEILYLQFALNKRMSWRRLRNSCEVN